MPGSGGGGGGLIAGNTTLFQNTQGVKNLSKSQPRTDVVIHITGCFTKL